MTDSRGAEREAPAAAPSGVFARHPRLLLGVALSVAFVLLGTGAVFAGMSWATPKPFTLEATPTSTPTPTIDPRAVPETLPAASRLRTCSVVGVAADPRLDTFSGYVVNALTGEALFDRGGTIPQRTGSVLKVVTAAAALNALGANGQLTTQVLDGGTPGVIVLKGGGDPTLATTPNTFYDGAPQIADLAGAAMAAYQAAHPGVPITQLILDSTMWTPDDRWDGSWLRKEQADGYQAEVTALMVNGGRADPTSSVSYRTSDPIGEAGAAFAAAAGLTGIAITQGTSQGGAVLAQVQSQPISTLVSQMLLSSDNILGENLARVTSVALGFDGSSASLALAIPRALANYGLDVSNVAIRDGSGLSDLNAVSPQFITALMMKIRTGEYGLGTIFGALPVAGESGTLASRFTGANEIARGSVIAKTGWLDAAYTLAGIVNSSDGTPLAFAFYSIRDGISSDAKQAQDSLATALFICGDNLSNN